MDKLTVEQVDRDRAIAYAREYLRWSGHLRAAVRQGQKDDHPLVQAFAAHRIAGEQAGRIAGLEEAARYIQHQYPHDKRVLVPAIRALKGPQ